MTTINITSWLETLTKSDNRNIKRHATGLLTALQALNPQDDD